MAHKQHRLVTPWGVAQRTMDCLMQSAWMEKDNTTTLSGHVHGHVQHLLAHRGTDRTSHAAVVDAIQILAALRFNHWSDAQHWRQQGALNLANSLAASAHADGSPIDETAALQERVWSALLAQATLVRDNGASTAR